jgi:hypothetical protein
LALTSISAACEYRPDGLHGHPDRRKVPPFENAMLSGPTPIDTDTPVRPRSRCSVRSPLAISVLAGVLAIIASPLPAQTPSPAADKTVRAQRTDQPITIDGRLDEPAWITAATVDDFYQILPVEYAQPGERTQVRLLYDDDALYVAAKMWDDEPDRITANVLRQGDQSSTDDDFTIILDPFNDSRSGYRFQINPNGVRREGLYQNTSQIQWDWQGIWQAETTRVDDGWIAEIQIPLKTLSFDPASDTWGINFSRRVARHDELSGWVSRNQSQNPSIAGEIVGLSGLRQGLGLDVVPSATVSEQKTFADGATDSNLEPSLDVYYKITPGLNAALTLNTDFSATEVDDRQVNLTRFGLFFPEKRDFFLQDSDIFEFGGINGQTSGGGRSPFERPLSENGRPYFSRKIGLSGSGQPVDLDAGARLSGRIGDWNIGTQAIRQAASGTVDASDLFVGRAQLNVLRESTVGVVVTDGDPRSNLSNSVVGADFRYVNSRLSSGRVIEADAWYQQSNTEGVTGDDTAWGARVRLPNNTGWKGELGIKEIGANFNPALGYINRTDIRHYTGEAGYTLRLRDRYVRSVYSNATVERVEWLDGELQSQNISLRSDIRNNSSDKVVATFSNQKEGLLDNFEISDGIFIPAGDYTFNSFRVHWDTSEHRKVNTRITVGTGDFYTGTRDDTSVFVEWVPNSHLRTSVSYSINDVSLPEGDFALRVTQIGFDYVFSSTLSWVNLIQYDNDSELVGINSRLHWIPEAGREMFLVFNHNLQDFDRDGTFHSSFADLSAKLNYTFRF